MVLRKKGIIIAAAGLVFVVGAALANIFLFPGVSPYLLTAALGSLTLSILLLFLPRLFKDHTPKIYRHKLANTISLFFSAKDRQNKFFHCILALSLLLLFVIRSLSKHDYLEDVSALQSTFLQPFQVGFAAILNCWWVGAMIYSLVAQFVQTDLLRNIEKWVAAPILFLITLFLPCCFEGVAGELSLLAVSPQALMMGFEYAIMVSFALESWLKDPSLKMSKSLGYGLLVAWLLLLLTTINDYLPKNLIGEYVRNLPLPKKFNLTHRIFIYTAFLLPIFYYLLLFPFDYTHRRAFLFFIALSVLFAYASVKRIEVWQHFYSMPLHLCNTAMYIMPLTLAFRSYRLFYFTMFINVIGAFLALMMPNYSDSWPTLGTAIVEFYINHIYAATLPVLIIELGIFERPKWKYFGYSMAGFAVYFVFVAVLNIYYTGTKSLYGIAAPDYFFINSDFIAKKVGTWAEDLWKMDFVWTQNGYTFELHWPYLLSYFSVYVLFALGMWYVYEILFKSTDELILLHENSRQYHVSQLQFEKLQERRDLPMEQNENSHEPRLLISHFTKRYGNAKTPAVEDFSLDISGGKIYGFLGKNGAGKSTIIKAVVGMHGFNEGSISVCGYDAVHESVKAKEQIGFVPDIYALYENLTGRQYINYVADIYSVSKKDRDERISRLLDRLEMRDHFDKQIKIYSHGMKQKITIIGALVHDPKIWILDEPMTGVDPNSIFQIKECMREHAAKGNIVFFSSHLIDVVHNLCNEILIIKRGKLIYASSMDEINAKGIDLEALFLEKTADTEEEAQALLKEEKRFGE